MGLVIEYKIVAGDTAPEVEAIVKEMLAEGWELQGGVSLSATETDDSFYVSVAQAMVRRGGGGG